MKRYTFVALLMLLTLLNTVHTGETSALGKGYDARLNGFPYPYPVKVFNIKSQNQALEMNYMYLKARKGFATFLLLHGKNFSGAYWESTASYLNDKGYGVLIPDQIGFGKSSKPPYYQYSIPQLAHNTMELISSVGLDSVVVMGHSMGGMIAARFALMYPTTTKRLILLNPIGLEDYLKYVKYKDVNFFYELELNKDRQKIRQYQEKFYYDGKWKKEYDPWVDMLAGWTIGPDRKLIAWNNALTYDMIFSNPVINEFERLSVPVELIIGTRDRTGPGRNWKREGVTYKLGQYQTLGKRASQLIEDVRLHELQDIGHLPQIEDFKRFSGVLDTILGDFRGD
ncbi:MAG: alpha/beta hydrolase [Desulfocapsaceae bacterium]|nr:alpha/beta hydrolase [Desulfocapsaceae bacterium]